MILGFDHQSLRQFITFGCVLNELWSSEQYVFGQQLYKFKFQVLVSSLLKDLNTYKEKINTTCN